jgi:hypothetical protein
MGKGSENINKFCSAYVGLEAKHTEDIVRECLVSFPYIWASVKVVLICDICLMCLMSPNS